MYTSFFGLAEKPFAITPDPRYLYLSERHAEALAHLLYGINESGGFIQLTGEVGTGKTTVVRTLLSRVPHHADVAVILNPRVTPVEFLLTICEELGLAIAEADRDSVKQMVDALNRRLLNAHAEGRRIIVLVDEAQNLSIEVLEQVRLLTNLETPTQKLLQIILIGQPELRELLDRTDLRQLAQRITGRYHLRPLSREETKGYVRHRLRVAGATEEIFTPGGVAGIAPPVAWAFRASSMWPAIVPCSAPIRRKRRKSPLRWCAGPPARSTAADFFPPGWAGSSGSLGVVALAGILVPRLAILAPSELRCSLRREQSRVPPTSCCRARCSRPLHRRRAGARRTAGAQAGRGQCAACKPMKPTPPMPPHSAACWRCGEPPWRMTGTPAGRQPRPGSPAWINAAPGPR